MEIAVLIGSLRQASYNRKLFEYYQSHIAAEVAFHEISTQPFPLYNKDLEQETLSVMAASARHIKQANAVMFFSPEYNYSIPGHLKNAIDWLSRDPSMPFNDKKAAILGGSPGAHGSAKMQYDLRKIGVYLNLHFLNKPEIMINQIHQKFDEQGALIDQATIDYLEKHWQAFKTFITQ